ncbi:hypothetical protein FRB94_013157 [Tulasnella sp. JGI-2019a]|nr:hypothetical protein FRB94_013157 [Tulasnella sp. JGI-2019a]
MVLACRTSFSLPTLVLFLSPSLIARPIQSRPNVKRALPGLNGFEALGIPKDFENFQDQHDDIYHADGQFEAQTRPEAFPALYYYPLHAQGSTGDYPDTEYDVPTQNPPSWFRPMLTPTSTFSRVASNTQVDREDGVLGLLAGTRTRHEEKHEVNDPNTVWTDLQNRPNAKKEEGGE